MLLWNLDLLFRSPAFFFVFLILTAVALLVAITVHEFSHALAAYQLGDYTAYRMGRLSLNPLVHLDPVGTILLFVAGFGWGKPVPVNPYGLRNGARSGMAMVAISGPLSNLSLAALLGLVVKLDLLPSRFPSLLSYQLFPALDGQRLLANGLALLIFYSIILAVFNLIPIAPLDGFNVALGVL